MMDDGSNTSPDLPASGAASPTIAPALSKKRKSPAPSCRGVANLTPEQLAKKRANDREAQRAIRERTKNHIDRLEKRIESLTSQRPYQELQEVLRQKQAIEDENKEIKRRLSSIMGIIQPLLGSQGGLGTDAPSFASSDKHLPREAKLAQRDHGQLSPPGDPQSRIVPQNLPSPVSLNAPENPSSVNTQSQQRPWPHDGENGNEQQPWSPANPFEYQRHFLQHGLDLGGSSGERLGLHFLIDTNQQFAKIPALRPGGLTRGSPPPSTIASSPIPNLGRSPSQSAVPFANDIHRSGIICCNGPPTCPLDVILLDFMTRKRNEASSSGGMPSSEQILPAYPSVSSLLNNTDQNSSIDHTSKVFADIISKFPYVAGLPEKVAVLYNMFLLMRWQIHPSPENFERLPEYIRPNARQTQYVHPAWMDYIPWPTVRDKIIANPTEYGFVDFFVPFTSGLSVNWPYHDTDTLLINYAPSNLATGGAASGDDDQSVRKEGSNSSHNDARRRTTPASASTSAPASSPAATASEGELMINPVFERHLRDLRNWSLGPDFKTTYPYLAEDVRIE